MAVFVLFGLIELMADVAEEVRVLYPYLPPGKGEVLQMRSPALRKASPMLTSLQGLRRKAPCPLPLSMGRGEFSGLGDMSPESRRLGRGGKGKKKCQ